MEAEKPFQRGTLIKLSFNAIFYTLFSKLGTVFFFFLQNDPKYLYKG